VGNVTVTVYALPKNYLGDKPSSHASEDLHKSFTVSGSSQVYTTPKSFVLASGTSYTFTASGAVVWDYYGIGHVWGSSATYTITDWNTEIACFFETAQCNEGDIQVLEYCPDGVTWKRRKRCVGGQWVEETQDCPNMPTTRITVKFYSLPLQYLGDLPSSHAGADLKKTIRVNGTNYTTPFSLTFNEGDTVNLYASGVNTWDYYGFGRKWGENVSYTIYQFDYEEIAGFWETTPPPPPTPQCPPSTRPICVVFGTSSPTYDNFTGYCRVLVCGSKAYTMGSNSDNWVKTNRITLYGITNPTCESSDWASACGLTLVSPGDTAWDAIQRGECGGAPPPAFDFNIAISPTSGTVQQGGSVTATIALTLASGSTQPVSLSVSGLPTGANANFNPSSCNPTCNSTLTISTSASTPTGTYSINITGSGGGKAHTTTYTLVVQPAPPPPPPSAQPVLDDVQPRTVNAGEQLTYSGHGFTPNGLVDVGIDGRGISAPDLKADSSGKVRITITVPQDVETGSQPAWLHDKTTDQNTNAIYVIIQSAPPPPSQDPVLDDVQPRTVKIGGKLTYTGHNFTPNGDVHACIDGIGYMGFKADPDGKVNINLTVTSEVQTGSQPAWLRDVAKAKDTNTINVAVEGGPVVRPTIDVTPKTVKQGEYITFTGSGFTPNGQVKMCLYQYVSPTIATADISGNFTGQMLVGTNIPTGQQPAWANDVTTDTNSNVVYITVEEAAPPPPPPCKEGQVEVLEYCPDGVTWKRRRVCRNGVWVEETQECPGKPSPELGKFVLAIVGAGAALLGGALIIKAAGEKKAGVPA